jgi:hypothetical protein
MARRKSAIIDGKIILDDTGGTIRDVLGRAGKGNPPSVVSGGEIIPATDFNRPAPAHDMLTNLTPLEKGAALRDRLLDQEFELIASRFLCEFPGRERSLELDDNTLLIRAFPLPDDYNPDHIDLLLVISGYPEVPPAGIHIPSQSPLRQQIDKHLGGHVHGRGSLPESDLGYVEGLTNYGRDWLCYSYHNRSWKLNPNTLLAGDCLYKFIENVFAALSGGHRD